MKMASLGGLTSRTPVNIMEDRLEAAEQRVTALLQQVDDNVMRAHDNASKLAKDVREFAGHAKAVQASVEIWVDFLRSFEECEREKFLAGQHEGDPSRNNSLMDVTADSLPSFFSSPRTPCLDDSMRAGLKRRYGSPGMVGDTPSFGASPPKSVKIKHTVLSDESSLSSKMSPVGQPVFDDQGDFKLDNSMQRDYVMDNDHANWSTASADIMPAEGSNDQSLLRTPSMSSPPTCTVQLDEDSFQPRAISAAQGFRTPVCSVTTSTIATPKCQSQGDATKDVTEYTVPTPRARRQTPARKSVEKQQLGGDYTPDMSVRRSARKGRKSVPSADLHIDLKLPELVLTNMPPVFRAGEGAVQICKVYKCFGCRSVTAGDEYPSLSFEDVQKLCPEYKADRVQFLLDALAAKRVLMTAESEEGINVWQYSGKEN